MSALERTRPPTPGPIRPFAFPTVVRRRLPNGLAVLAARHGDVPLVTAQLVVRAGAASEPAGKAGLAYLTAAALETGTESRPADRIAWELEYLGVEFEAEATWDATLLSVTVPRERLEPALELFADVIRNPAFPAHEVERLRDQQLAAILQRAKEPRALANDMAGRFIFAPAVPYARPLIGTTATVERLTRTDVENLFGAHFVANAAALLFTGGIDADAAEALARRHFGDWRTHDVSAADFDVQPRVQETTVFVVHRPGAVQSEIRIGDVGVARDHPDYFPLVVMNTLLGGAFTSRLNMSLRERHGFTYGAHSGFAFRRRPGPFIVQTAAATDVTARAVQEALRELAALRDDGPTDEELASARDYLRGVLPLQLQTTDQLAGRLAELVVYELPDDYFDHYRDEIAAVSGDAVRRVAREYLRLDRLAIVVVGDADHVRQPLEALGVGPVDVPSIG